MRVFLDRLAGIPPAGPIAMRNRAHLGRALGTLLAFGLAAPSALLAQSATLTVTVQTATGAARPGAKVVRYQGATPLDTLVTNAFGQVSYAGLTAGATYSFEAYYEGLNPFDTLGELWSTRSITLAAGANSLLMRRDWPYVETFRFFRVSDNVELTSAHSIPAGTAVRLDALVRNPGTTRTVRVRMALDRNQALPWDLDQMPAQATVPGAGGSATFSSTFTPTTAQTGTFQRAVKTETLGSTWIKTDAWNWGQTFTVIPHTVTVTVQNQNGVARPGASVVRYQSGSLVDTQVTNSSGQYTYSNLAAGTAYTFEAYYAGPNPFDSLGELWTTAGLTVQPGNNPLTMRRDWPHAELLRVYRVSDNLELTSASSIPAGTELRVEVVVRNKLSTARTVRVRMALDRDTTGGWDFDLDGGQASVPANSVFAFSVHFTPSTAQTGSFHKTVKTETLASTWVKTDAWDWSSAFTVVPHTLTVTVQNQNGAPRPGAKLVRYLAGNYVDTRTADAAGQCLYPDLAVGTVYDFEAYYEGANPFDTLGELWSAARVTVQPGQNTLTMPRDWPYVEDVRVYRVSDNVQLTVGSPMPAGTTVRIEALVRNRQSSARMVRVHFLLDRNQTGGWDFEEGTVAASVAGGTVFAFSVQFTPTATQTGPFSHAVKTETAVGANWVKTDAWNWGPTFTVVPNSLAVTVQNQEGVPRSGAILVRYEAGVPPDHQVTDSVGQYTYPSLPAGATYDLEAYYEGVNAFDMEGELWTTATVTVEPGAHTLTMRRDWPYVESLRVFRVSDNAELTASSSVSAGTELRVEAVVRNRLAGPRTVRVRMVLDRDPNGEHDFDQTSADLSVRGDGTYAVSIPFTPNASQTGRFHQAVKTETLGLTWVKTDGWNWAPTFLVEGPLAPATPAPILPADGGLLQTLTPTFEWSPFVDGGDGQSQAGYQLRVRRDDPLRWEFDTATDWGVPPTGWLDGSWEDSPHRYRSATFMERSTLQIGTRGGSADRVKIRTASEHRVASYDWVVYVPPVTEPGARNSIGAFLYSPQSTDANPREVDFEIFYGSSAMRVQYGIPPGKVMCLMTLHDGSGAPPSQYAVAVDPATWYALRIVVGVDDAGKYVMHWLVGREGELLQAARPAATAHYGIQETTFHAYASLENLDWTGDFTPMQDHEAHFDRISVSDYIVYDTGLIADTSARQHLYAPGAFTQWDPVALTLAMSEPLEDGGQYHWHVRYRGSAGPWSAWSADVPGFLQHFVVQLPRPDPIFQNGFESGPVAPARPATP
jgi:uncharacterized protein YndB with AHSA1/START domain